MRRSNKTYFFSFLLLCSLQAARPLAAIGQSLLPFDHLGYYIGDESLAPGALGTLAETLTETVILLSYLQGNPVCFVSDFSGFTDPFGCLYWYDQNSDRLRQEQRAISSNGVKRQVSRNKVWFGGAPLQTPRKRNRVHHTSFQGKMPPLFIKKKSEEK